MIALLKESRRKLSSNFVKIWPPQSRLKGPDSLVEKAFYRGKAYTDPYSDITDKVGVRYVVLLTSNISEVEQSINEIDDWEATKDKDFEEERARQPMLFDYQSVHYIVRAVRDTHLGA